jgi:hypothetical protein
MCDQDHFEDDRTGFERSVVTRKQFGVLLGRASR